MAETGREFSGYLSERAAFFLKTKIFLHNLLDTGKSVAVVFFPEKFLWDFHKFLSSGFVMNAASTTSSFTNMAGMSWFYFVYFRRACGRELI